VIQLVAMSPEVPLEEATVSIDDDVFGYGSLHPNLSTPALRTYGADLGEVLHVHFGSEQLIFALPDGRAIDSIRATVAIREQVLAVHVGRLAFVDLDLGPRPPGGFPGLEVSVAVAGEERTLERWQEWSNDPAKTVRVPVRPGVLHGLLVHPHPVAGEAADPTDVWGLDGPITVPMLAPGQTLRLAVPMHPLRGEIVGRVVSEDGPLADSYVTWAGRVPGSPDLPYLLMGRTDRDGCFTLRGAMEGTGRLGVPDSPKLTLYALPEGLGLRSQDGAVVAAGEVRLERAGRIEGRCVGPIAEEQYVYASSPGANAECAKVEADGSFRFSRLKEGRFALHVCVGGFPPQDGAREHARTDVRSGQTTFVEIALPSNAVSDIQREASRRLRELWDHTR